MSSGAPEVALVAHVVLLSRKSWFIVTIDVSQNRYRNGFVFTTVERYPMSFVKWRFRTCQRNHDGDRKTSTVMTLIFPLERSVVFQRHRQRQT